MANVGLDVKLNGIEEAASKTSQLRDRFREVKQARDDVESESKDLFELRDEQIDKVRTLREEIGKLREELDHISRNKLTVTADDYKKAKIDAEENYNIMQRAEARGQANTGMYRSAQRRWAESERMIEDYEYQQSIQDDLRGKRASLSETERDLVRTRRAIREQQLDPPISAQVDGIVRQLLGAGGSIIGMGGVGQLSGIASMLPAVGAVAGMGMLASMIAGKLSNATGPAIEYQRQIMQAAALTGANPDAMWYDQANGTDWLTHAGIGTERVGMINQLARVFGRDAIMARDSAIRFALTTGVDFQEAIGQSSHIRNLVQMKSPGSLEFMLSMVAGIGQNTLGGRTPVAMENIVQILSAATERGGMATEDTAARAFGQYQGVANTGEYGSVYGGRLVSQMQNQINSAGGTTESFLMRAFMKSSWGDKSLTGFDRWRESGQGMQDIIRQARSEFGDQLAPHFMKKMGFIPNVAAWDQVWSKYSESGVETADISAGAMRAVSSNMASFNELSKYDEMNNVRIGLSGAAKTLSELKKDAKESMWGWMRIMSEQGYGENDRTTYLEAVPYGNIKSREAAEMFLSKLEDAGINPSRELSQKDSRAFVMQSAFENAKKRGLIKSNAETYMEDAMDPNGASSGKDWYNAVGRFNKEQYYKMAEISRQSAMQLRSADMQATGAAVGRVQMDGKIDVSVGFQGAASQFFEQKQVRQQFNSFYEGSRE